MVVSPECGLIGRRVTVPTAFRFNRFPLIHHRKISFVAKETDVVEWDKDILLVGVTEEDMTKDHNSRFQNPILAKLDSKYDGILSEVCSEENFTGKAEEGTAIRVAESKRIILIGLGKFPISSSFSGYHSLGEYVESSANAFQGNNVSVTLANSKDLTLESRLAIASKITKGILLHTYDGRFIKFMKPSLKSVNFYGLGCGPEFEKKLKSIEDICSGVIWGIELVTAPSNVLTPEVLAEEAAKIAETYSDVFKAKILDTEQCKELKMGSYLGTAAASTNPPKFIHLCYKHPSGSKAKLALVAKGSIFDSCGHNNKIGPGSMGGSAAVLGVAKVLGQIKPPGVEVHFIVPACKNVISRNDMRHVLTASNGKTIEVNDTDAEERLALADALVFACNQGVDKVIDLATMTGACAVALGPSIAGIYTNNDELFKEVVTAAEVAGEKLWRLPLEESYWGNMKSKVADMAITGGRHDCSITAALFLKQFVKEGVQWLHIDMAAPVWNYEKETATGFPIHTLVEWIMSHSDLRDSVSHSGEHVAATNEASSSRQTRPKLKRPLLGCW